MSAYATRQALLANGPSGSTVTVVGATGHQNIPDAALAYKEKEIRRVIGQLGSDLTGVSSLAEGVDQLFAEIVLLLGGRLRVVIPCDRYEATFDSHALESYRHLLRKADMVETLQQRFRQRTPFWTPDGAS